MYKKKDLLVVMSIFGIAKNENMQIAMYVNCLESVFWHIKKNNLQDSVRVVVSSVITSERCKKILKAKFKENISIIDYSDRYSVQVSANKSILHSIEQFQEEYEGYMYLSSGVLLPEVEDLFPRIIEKSNSGEYGIMHLQVDRDQGYEWLGKGKNYHTIDFSQDYDIPIGNHCNFHVAVLNKALKDFYEVPITDVHGLCCMESGLPYTTYALRKKYILIGNSVCKHYTSFDKFDRMINTAGVQLIGYNKPGVNCGLMWDRERREFLEDKEGIESGLGYYPGPIANNEPDWNGVILPHNREKYDENCLSTDERLKFAVKRRYFTNKTEIDYDKINCNLIR